MRYERPDNLPELPEGVDGILYNWNYHPISHVFTGGIFSDRKGRFADGQLIHTSHCHNPGAVDGEIIRTRNSSYLLFTQWVDINEKFFDNSIDKPY